MKVLRSPLPQWYSDEQYRALPAQERALLQARSLDDIREVGNNRGFWVEKLLASVGLGPGYPWCAAYVSYCIEQAAKDGEVFGPMPRYKRAAVRRWVSHYDWLERNRGVDFVRPVREVERGDLVFWLNKSGHGHIFFCLHNYETRGALKSIEGNTSSATQGREGDGTYELIRTYQSLEARHRSGCIKWYLE